MSVQSGSELTYALKGIREQLSDAIYNIDPTDTPYLNMIGRDEADNTLFDWQIDTFATPVTTNQVVEGNVAAYTEPSYTGRVGNYCEIAEKTAAVSGTAQRVKKAGRKDEMGFQLGKRSVEIKRDIESSLFANKGANPGAAAVARQTAGLGAWLFTNTVFGSGGGDPVYTSLPTNARTDGTQAALTEGMLTDVLGQMWTSGAEASTILVGAFNKAKISAFTGNATKTIDLTRAAKPGVIVASMDVYVGEFDTIKVLPSRWQRARDAFLIDPEFAAVAYLRPFHTEAMGKTGDNELRVVRAEYGHKIKNEKAHGGIFDLTTTA